MKSEALIITFSVLLAAIACAYAESTTTTEAAWSPQVPTQSLPASQWSWTEFFQFIKNSTSTENKFYFFF